MKRLAALLLLSGCATAPKAPVVPNVQIQTVTKEVQRPCHVTKPVRPAKLAQPLPTDSEALAALLGAKLIEWAGEGGYGDRAESAIATCSKP
jgi:hypothetical protein